MSLADEIRKLAIQQIYSDLLEPGDGLVEQLAKIETAERMAEKMFLEGEIWKTKPDA